MVVVWMDMVGWLAGVERCTLGWRELVAKKRKLEQWALLGQVRRCRNGTRAEEKGIRC